MLDFEYPYRLRGEMFSRFSLRFSIVYIVHYQLHIDKKT